VRCVRRRDIDHHREVQESVASTVRSHWGLGSRVLASIFLGDSDSAEQERLARYQRVAASPDTAAALLEFTYRNDVRAELHKIRAPTSVVHRRGDRAIPYRLGREPRRGHPGRHVDSSRRRGPPPWLAIGRRRRVPCARCWLPKFGRAVLGILRRPCSRPASAKVLALVARQGLSDQEIA
jgi:pimeloyl-ACP methyl ester carboxylesterase